MWRTCNNVEDMSKMIQIRHVPEELHRRLKARAAQAGMSLSDFLLGELREIGARPSKEEFLGRLASRSRVELDVDLTQMVRDERESR